MSTALVTGSFGNGRGGGSRTKIEDRVGKEWATAINDTIISNNEKNKYSINLRLSFVLIDKIMTTICDRNTLF